MGGPYLWDCETSLHRADLTHRLGGGPEGGAYPDLKCLFTNTRVRHIHCADPYERLCPGGGPGGGANPDLTCQFANSHHAWRLYVCTDPYELLGAGPGGGAYPDLRCWFAYRWHTRDVQTTLTHVGDYAPVEAQRGAHNCRIFVGEYYDWCRGRISTNLRRYERQISIVLESIWLLGRALQCTYVCIESSPYFDISESSQRFK